MRLRLALLAAAVTCVFAAAAQETAEVHGRITDASGAAVSGAAIRATHIDTSVAVNATADHKGEYRLVFPAPGVYRVEVSMQGFATYRREAVEARGSVTLDVRLELRKPAQRIDVVAAAAARTGPDDAAGAVFEAETIQALPARDDNPVMLMLLGPGVTNLAEGTTRPFDNENVSMLAINGASAGTHEFQIDGAANTGGASGNVAQAPPAGVVSEVRVDNSPYDARNGFAMGSRLSLYLRSGANRPHGQLIYYLENPDTNANSFFSNKSGSGHDNFRENRWGASASGPVEIPGIYHGRNRTFWMYGYDGIRASQPYRYYNLTYTVPTPSERRGDLADLLAYGKQYQIYDPKTTRAATTAGRYTRDPFPGNVIPASRVDQTAVNLIERYYPLANLPGAKPTGVNYTMPSLQLNEFQSHTARIDQVIGTRQRVFVRAGLSDRDQELERRFNGGAGAVGERQNRGFGVDDAIMFGSRFLMNARYNYTRYVDNYGPPSAGIDLSSLGFSSAYIGQILGVDPRNMMLPDVLPSGYPELNPQAITRLASDIHAAGIDFTRVARAHTVQFGGEHRIYRDATGNIGRAAGRINFNTSWTRGPLDNSAASPIGQGLASFLLGLPTDGGMDINPSLAQQYQVSGWYAQDTWRARPRLTVNFGLRWEFEAPLTERYDRSVRDFDFDTVSPIAAAAQAAYAKSPIAQIPAAAFQVRGGLTFAGVNSEPRGLWDGSFRNLAPRAGVAWKLTPKTVARAGYGMFYDIARQFAIQTGFSRTTTLVASQDVGQTYVASLENPFPRGFAQPTGSSLGLMTGAGQAVSAFPTQLLNPYSQRWDFTIQRSLGQQAVFDIAYVGNRATHLRLTRQFDPVPAEWLSRSLVRNNAQYGLLTTNVKNPFYPLLPGTSLAASTVAASQLLRPYPQFTSVTAITNDGFSWYHSLQSRLIKRFSRGYMMTAAYTWSKFMEATAFLNESDPAPTHAISPQDRTHRIVASAIYDFPFRRRSRWLGGWQVHGIYQWQSGAPLSFGNVLYYGGSMGAIELPPDQRTPARWFNTASFERNSALQLVYNIRTFPLRLAGLRSMGLNMADLGVSKTARVSERVNLQLRADAFNALNHTHFGLPNTSPMSTDFGAVTTTSQLPRVIEFSARMMF